MISVTVIYAITKYLCVMNTEKPADKDLYYTHDHEWIEFQGSVAYIGICSFKLTGFKEIQEIKFKETSGLKKQGEVITTIRYNDYEIEVHMPVDGRLVEVNEKLINGDQNYLLKNPENSGWIALIVPSQPEERKDLLLTGQYLANFKSNYAEQPA